MRRLLGGSSGGAVAANQWVYVTYTFDNTVGTVAFYANGSQVGSTSYALTGTTANDEPLMLGIGILLQTQYFFAGAIDDVRIYNRALTPTEVKTLYAAGG